MIQQVHQQRPPRRDAARVLAIAYACHPEESAESRVGWARVVMASHRHDVTVLCCSQVDAGELKRLAELHGADPSIQFVVVPHCLIGSFCCSHDLSYYTGYRLWHRRAAAVGKKLHAEQPFDLVHQVNFCGFREPGYGWQIGAPFVWGPIGGTHNFPVRFLGMIDPYNAFRELTRNLVNTLQLRVSPRLRRIARDSTCVLAATRLAQHDLHESWGVDAAVELEAGLSYPARPPRERRDADRPLRVLWTGRLRAWKGLPLLLRALAECPQRCELRVLGEGSDLGRLKKLARRLGVDDQIEWVGWGPYESTLPHYDWADVFAFTSLRDTSGAGLLEALAAGLPIIGLNHQGAADIMTERCAIPVEPTGPAGVVTGVAAALDRLSTDSELLLRLSRGASNRAVCYEWERRGDRMDAVYEAAMATGSHPVAVDDSGEYEAVAAPRRGDLATLEALGK